MFCFSFYDAISIFFDFFSYTFIFSSSYSKPDLLSKGKVRGVLQSFISGTAVQNKRCSCLKIEKPPLTRTLTNA